MHRMVLLQADCWVQVYQKALRTAGNQEQLPSMMGHNLGSQAEKFLQKLYTSE